MSLPGDASFGERQGIYLATNVAAPTGQLTCVSAAFGIDCYPMCVIFADARCRRARRTASIACRSASSSPRTTAGVCAKGLACWLECREPTLSDRAQPADGGPVPVTSISQEDSVRLHRSLPRLLSSRAAARIARHLPRSAPRAGFHSND